MFAIGHFSLAYILGKYSAKIVNSKINFALLFTASILPDIDLFFLDFIKHRGPTHSLIFCLLIFIPLFIKYKKKAIPYFIVLLSHPLIGDIFSGGTQLFWPISNQFIYISNISVINNTHIALELILFIASTIIMIASSDIKKIVSEKTNIFYWIIPFGSVLLPLLPLLITPKNYNHIPTLLLIPSLYYIGLFLSAIYSNILKLRKPNTP